MPLATLNWRYVGFRTFTAGNLPASHDAVYTLGTATTYADASTRTPGTGSAWTWNRQQATGTTVACYGEPPLNPLTFRYIIANTVAFTAYTFLTPDTAELQNCVIYGMNRSSGAFTTWTSATPFTNAGFSGYWRGTRNFTNVPFDSVAMWESQEGVLIQYGHSASGVTSSIAMGALLDPLSTAAANAESDGRVYAMLGSGTNANTSATWGGLNSDGAFWGGTGGNGQSHCGAFSPGTKNMIGGAGAQFNRVGLTTTLSTFTSTNGDIVRVPICVLSQANGNFIGQFRNIYLTKDATTRLAYQNGASVLGYVWSPTLTTANDAVILTY